MEWEECSAMVLVRTHLRLRSDLRVRPSTRVLAHFQSVPACHVQGRPFIYIGAPMYEKHGKEVPDFFQKNAPALKRFGAMAPYGWSAQTHIHFHYFITLSSASSADCSSPIIYYMMVASICGAHLSPVYTVLWVSA